MTRKHFWFGMLVMVALGAAAYWYTMGEHGPAASAAAPAAIPVIATDALIERVSEYLAGLGSVQAFNRVTVHVRVDGELQEIDFTEGQNVHQGDVLAKIDPRLFQATLDQAKAKVDQLVAALDADQAAIENGETQLSYTTIAAPLSGRLGIRLIDRGNIVHAGDPGGLVVITQVQPIAVMFSLQQDYLQDITAAMKKKPLKVLAYSRDNVTKLGEGTLLLIDNQIDAATGTLRLKASFPNDDDALWPGQFVNARLELAVRPNAVAVPAQVVQRGPNALYAYVVKPDQSVERRPIKVGPVRDGRAVIEAGLSPGERVVVDGQFKLRPGAKVVVTLMPAGDNKASAEKTAERLP